MDDQFSIAFSDLSVAAFYFLCRFTRCCSAWKALIPKCSGTSLSSDAHEFSDTLSLRCNCLCILPGRNKHLRCKRAVDCPVTTSVSQPRLRSSILCHRIAGDREAIGFPTCCTKSRALRKMGQRRQSERSGIRNRSKCGRLTKLCVHGMWTNLYIGSCS
jgi:hypothetical protein